MAAVPVVLVVVRMNASGADMTRQYASVTTMCTLTRYALDAWRMQAARRVAGGIVIAIAVCSASVFSGCAAIEVSEVSAEGYIDQRRGDVLSTRQISAATSGTLQVVGLDVSSCRRDSLFCLDALSSTTELTEERRVAALAEVWLDTAMRMEYGPQPLPQRYDALNAYLEAAKHAYAYLFFTERPPRDRTFEERQTQVRDYYNFAVQQATAQLFSSRQPNAVLGGASTRQAAGWIIHKNLDEDYSDHAVPAELIPASELSFAGLHSIYRRDGLGAEFVAVMPDSASGASGDERPAYSQTPYPVATAVMRFAGNDLASVMQSRELEFVAYDPYRHETVEMGNTSVPLAANFTAGFGLWLSRSHFSNQAIRTLLGRGGELGKPHVYMLQPYDPNRRILIMVHGLASSPDAWMNAANEVLGDETLRNNYQIWQVYYPTNAPIAPNHYLIRQALGQAFAHFDPQRKDLATHDIVVVGHSMGGIMARMLVSSSGDRLWTVFLEQNPLEVEELARVHQELDPYLAFEPEPGITRAIFLATPHRGTPFAELGIARWFANLITLPLAMLQDLSQLNKTLAEPGRRSQTEIHLSNSVYNLSDKDPAIRVIATMPISPTVKYHSIIGYNTPGARVVDSSDGIVPYASSHMDGMQSELVVRSDHSVEEKPVAILETRRILREHLKASEADRR